MCKVEILTNIGFSVPDQKWKHYWPAVDIRNIIKECLFSDGQN